MTKIQTLQESRLAALPYRGDADSNITRSRGPKAAVLCNGLVGFYWAEEVGQVVSDLVQVGLTVTVLPAQNVEIR